MSEKWKSDIRTGIAVIINDDEHHSCLSGVDAIATINGNGEESQPYGYRYITDKQVAIAHLIAAAPELYEALEHLLETKEYKDKYGKDKTYELARETSWNNAKAALAKARGEK